jgi:membrane protein DedA with SNARE-associated domain
MDVISWAIQVSKDLIASGGLVGIFFLMSLESMCLPVPSEIVMTFGGWLVFDGRLDFLGVMLAGTIGCVAGSLIAYYIGEKGGRGLVHRYGRALHLNESSIQGAEGWFKKHGDLAVFGSRLLPVVRTFISLPAGLAKMNLTRFTVLTLVGSLIWCLALTYAGFLLGASWESIREITVPLTIVVLVVTAVVLIWYFFIRKKKEKPETVA